jgi:IclR family mhp operon transcriptional activator
MVVRVSTRSYSPLSFHPGMPGRRMPLLTTAAGRAYLAYAPEQEVQVLLELIAGRSDEPGTRVIDESFVRRLTEKTRCDGYATNQGEWSAESKFGAVSVPLRHQGRVLACLNVIFLLRALDKKPAALKNIVTHLQDAAAKIEESFAALPERPA